MNASREMPRYRCHKQVWALKIKSITAGPGSSCIITPDEAGYEPFSVPAEYMVKHAPKAGGYYVVYLGGYRSYSPAAAFEEGYTRETA